MPILSPLAALLLCCASPPAPALPVAQPNDNRIAAGEAVPGVRRIRLVVRRAAWYPDGRDAPALLTEAVGEEGKPLQIPAPLVRVDVGTRVDASVRNALPDTIVFAVQCGVSCRDSVYLAPGATRALPIRTDRAGTFTYASVLVRGGRPWLASAAATQAGGAIVVDPAGAPPDRVLVISQWIQQWDTTKARDDDRLIMTINGRMWPHTERWRFTVGDSVRWRVVNVSGDSHPMHLHGFYFRVDSRGDGASDSVYVPGERRWAVTESVAPFGTFTMTWVPQRPGNWLLHCHKGFHMSGFQHADLAGERLDYNLPSPHDAHASDAEHLARGMAGLVMGVEVAPRAADVVRGAAAAAAPRQDAGPVERLRLLAQHHPGPHGRHGYVLQRGDSVPAPDSVLVPGPPLVLTRGRPVEITVVNHLDAPTGVHWHGIELDSYYDGVGGWSGAGARVAPRVAPNDSFVVRFTPPRAGTFMYHSHSEEVRQIGLGLYGAIVVLEPGERWDPSTDHLVVLGDTFVDGRPFAAVNGATASYPLRLAAGKLHRLRLINIMVDDDAEVALLDAAGPVRWRVVAKDGADLPPARRGERPAAVRLGPGETMDVELAPAPGRYRLRVLSYSNVLVDVQVR